MIKYCKRIMCALIAATFVFSLQHPCVYASASVVKCYADTDEIVLTYDSADISADDVTLSLDGADVGVTATVDDNRLILTPADGEFDRDVIYTISDGSYTNDFMIKTLVDGINKADLNSYDGPTGKNNDAVVFIDSDDDGVEELFCLNRNTIFFNNNDAKQINSTKDYTVKYDIASYAITSDMESETLKPSEYYNVVVSSMHFNASSTGANSASDGFMLYRSNWQPIKLWSGNSWTVTDITPADAGLSAFTDKQDGSTQNHGLIFYDGGTSDISVLKPAEASAQIKLKKNENSGTLYIDGVEKSTTAQGTANSGYFLFGGGESGHTFLQIKNFVATTCVNIVPPEALVPQSYNLSATKAEINFNDAITAIKSGSISVRSGENEIPVDVEISGNTTVVTPIDGEFPTDEVLRIVISEDFGDDAYRTENEFYRDFKIEVVQSGMNESNFGKSTATKLYKDGKLYFTNGYITPLNANSNIKDYTIKFKLRPFLIKDPRSANNVYSLYMRISFNNETPAVSLSNKGSAWNFQNYDQFLTHTNWDEEKQAYNTNWTNRGSWSAMKLPATADLVQVSLENNDAVFSAEPTYDPVDVTIEKKGTDGTISIGEVTDSLSTPNETGYFVISQYQNQFSVVEISDFVMTTVREYTEISVEGDTELIDTDSSICVNLYGAADESVFASAVTLTDLETGETLSGYECTLSADKTKLYISDPADWVRGKRIGVNIDTAALGVADSYWNQIQNDDYYFEFSVGNGDIYPVISNASANGETTAVTVNVFNKTGETKNIYMIAALYGDNAEFIGLATNEFSLSGSQAQKQISVPNSGKTVKSVKIHLLNSATDAKPYCEAAIREVK